MTQYRTATAAYTIRTDAGLVTLRAATMNHAARKWAASKGYRGVRTASDLLRRIARIDGAWMWIEGPEGRIGGSTEDALRDYR